MEPKPEFLVWNPSRNGYLYGPYALLRIGLGPSLTGFLMSAFNIEYKGFDENWMA